MNFTEAYELPIGQYVEKKGNFSYLSWCYAVKFLRENFPEATWKIHCDKNELPFFTCGNGAFVAITVFLEGKGYTQFHPVLDNKNKAIVNPNVFQINTSIQRCLAKAIGIATGIGLGLYAGEDLPVEEKLSPIFTELMAALDECSGLVAMEKWSKDNKTKLGKLNATEADILRDHYRGMKEIFEMEMKNADNQ